MKHFSCSSSIPQTRPILARILRIQQLMEKGGFPNCSAFAREFEVSERTIHRDLDFMRDRLEMPIEYDSRKRGFYFSSPIETFPAITVTEADLVALFIAEKVLAQYAGTGLEEPLRQTFQKLAHQLDGHVSVKWHDLQSTVSFRSTGVARADLKLFQKIAKAVIDREELEFSYSKLNNPNDEPRRVHPYHIAWVNAQWYLLAHDLARQQLRTFALSRSRD